MVDEDDEQDNGQDHSDGFNDGYGHDDGDGHDDSDGQDDCDGLHEEHPLVPVQHPVDTPQLPLTPSDRNLQTALTVRNKPQEQWDLSGTSGQVSFFFFMAHKRPFLFVYCSFTPHASKAFRIQAPLLQIRHF
jgi:hypothetical protein